MYRSVISSTRLPVSILIPECRDIQDQFWPLKLQKKIGEWNWFNREYGSKLSAGKNKNTTIEPNYTSGRGQCETKFPVYENNSVKMYRPLVHLRGERKTTEVLWSYLSQNGSKYQSNHLYAYLAAEQSFRICYKAQSTNYHPSPLRETLYRRIDLLTKQSFIWRKLTSCNCLYFCLCDCWWKLKTA